ncbi:hypothetical protein HH303_18910 [Rhodospirillaceae bacterium KN72]|uniref:Uncharacterized protein n=1 Tax=Pacificispira spongiicola TaxID=2729598 RepID=A0A7Y0HIH6_9PROT|nr:hypothetical protein [Pacificispira spongiicola]NMM46569.1 hypothetical protein [Pacificispira spongiicola]
MKSWLAMFGLIMAFAAPAAARDYVLPGTLHLTNGTLVQCEDINLTDLHYSKGGIVVKSGYYESETNSFHLKKLDQNISILLNDMDIRSLSIMIDGDSWGDSTMIEVVLKNGNIASMGVFKDRSERSLGSRLVATCEDTFTGKKQEQTLYWGTVDSKDGPRVLSANFEETGNVKWSNGSKRFFPVGFEFDPYTGERLILKNTVE